MNNRIKEVREKKGMTQEAFGEKLGVARNTVANYENGNRTPSKSVIRSICREFRIREDWLVNGVEPMEDDSDLSFSDICMKIGVSDEKARNAIIQYWQLPDEDKELFWKFVERFGNKKEGG